MYSETEVVIYLGIFPASVSRSFPALTFLIQSGKYMCVCGIAWEINWRSGSSKFWTAFFCVLCISFRAHDSFSAGQGQCSSVQAPFSLCVDVPKHTSWAEKLVSAVSPMMKLAEIPWHSRQRFYSVIINNFWMLWASDVQGHWKSFTDSRPGNGGLSSIEDAQDRVSFGLPAYYPIVFLETLLPLAASLPLTASAR